MAPSQANAPVVDEGTGVSVRLLLTIIAATLSLGVALARGEMTSSRVAKLEDKQDTKSAQDSDVRERLVRLEENVKVIKEDGAANRATSERIERKIDRNRRDER